MREFWVEGGELWRADVVAGQAVRLGQPDGYPVLSVLTIPHSEDCIVLLAYWKGPEGRAFRNLLRCRQDGSVVWRAELPVLGSDEYVEAEWTSNGLTAYSGSGFAVHLDLDTGRILSSIFTK